MDAKPSVPQSLYLEFGEDIKGVFVHSNSRRRLEKGRSFWCTWTNPIRVSWRLFILERCRHWRIKWEERENGQWPEIMRIESVDHIQQRGVQITAVKWKRKYNVCWFTTQEWFVVEISSLSVPIWNTIDIVIRAPIFDYVRSIMLLLVLKCNSNNIQ